MGLFYRLTVLIIGTLLSVCPMVICWPQATHGIDNIRFEHISAGLSQSTVTCILQDKKGFMWFGTRNGLNRFDGVEFTTFENVVKDSTSLSHNYVTSLFEDSKGNLWVGTLEGGLNLFNKDKETFSHFIHDKNNSSTLSHNNVNCIYEDRNHRLWIGTENGLNYFVSENQSFVCYRYDQARPWSLSDNNIGVIFEDSKFNLWVGTKGGGLEFFDQKNQRFVHHRHNATDTKTISNNVISTYYKDSKGGIWLGTQNGLNFLVQKPGGAEFVRYQHTKYDPNSPGNSSILSISEDLFGRLWIGTQISGLSIYDKKKNVFFNIYPDPLDQYSISSNSLWSIFRDRMGTMWVGARNRGLDKWDRHQQKFNQYNIAPSGNYTLSNKDVTCFLEDDRGNFWIGTDGGGLSYFDRKSNKYTSYIHDPQQSNSLGSNAVLSLLIDSKGNLWVGTWGGGLNRFDKKTKGFQHYIHNRTDPASINGNNIFTMCEDSYGNFWVGVFYGGLNLFNPETDSFLHYNYNPDNSNSLSSNQIIKIFEDSNRNLWIGTNGGGLDLLHWKGKDRVSFTHYKYESNSPDRLSSNVINSITEDGSHNLWIGTGKGLNKINHQNQTFRVYSKENGLPDNVVNAVVEDKNGFLWLSTNHGISKLDPVSGKIKNYTTADGLQSQEFIKGSFLKSKTGELFFGGVNGFNSFFPENIKDKSFISPLYLTEFRIRNVLIKPDQKKSPLRKHISETKEIILSYDNNDFSLGFAALNYSTAFKSRYSYLLEGYDENWQSVGTIRNASYAKVPAGHYRFRVKSIGNDGLYNKQEASINIIVLPPWWRTWWAYMLYGLAFIGLLWWYRQILIRQLRLENDLKIEHLELTKMQEMERLKSNFFANISHEFRTPLTLILSPLKDMYSNNFGGDFKTQYQIMIRNAERLLKLINQLLDLSKLDSGNMQLDASRLNLNNFLKPIFLSFDSYAKRKQIKYCFVNHDAPVELYADPDKLEKIVTNLLSNAFKFTDSGEIKLAVKTVRLTENDAMNISEAQEFVEICVSDSGVGIAPEYLSHIFNHFYQVAHRVYPGDQEGTGIGLSLAKELAELHNGKMEVESQVGVGTTFRVILPLGKEHFNATDINEESPRQVYRERFVQDSEQTLDEVLLPHNILLPDTELPVVLLVEDNDDMRKYLKERLERNYYILEAVNGAEGLKAGMDKMPDLIISDVLMPVMNGFEMCKNLKDNVQTSHIPIILLTAQADSVNKIEGLETGADDYVSKPFDSNELEVRVRNLIKSREMLIERFTRSNKLILEPKEITITPLDEIFIKKVLESIEANISDPEFRVEDLGKDVGMSRMPLYKKIKALTGQTAVEFVRTIRLKRAAQLLKQNQLTVSEITYDVGFNDLQYFRTCFKKQFGVSPSEYARMNFAHTMCEGPSTGNPGEGCNVIEKSDSLN
ncbi:two-component regulator propeller domain-containing protein [Dyadobacter frigoris]|uniref:histidine kinase n=1 Tax=Dyadobacter frigoris TaxID=2576211 RepID=A0A4U6D8Q5_9BACT|nr:two-component regulator propeller domain-containing protein [Dyadobacter frigoris]TKT92488.1 response regulator [Dyadobacter frigoris]